jgi:hypothetical protein
MAANLMEVIQVNLQTSDNVTSNIVSTQSDTYSNTVLSAVGVGDYALASNVGTGLALPVPTASNTALVIYIKNLGTGSQTITVLTDFSAPGVLAPIYGLAAGGFFLVCPSIGTQIAGGVANVSVLGNVANVPFFYKILG